MNIRDDPGAGREQDSPGNWPDESLDEIVDMIDGRDFVSEKFDQHQHHQQPDHPPAGQRVPGALQLDQVCEARQQRHDQQGDVGVESGAGSQTKC